MTGPLWRCGLGCPDEQVDGVDLHEHLTLAHGLPADVLMLRAVGPTPALTRSDRRQLTALAVIVLVVVLMLYALAFAVLASDRCI